MHRRRSEGLFERGSNVVDYWLAHCEGFRLGGSISGRRVTAVVCDPHTGRARTLFVSSGRRRAHTLPAQAIGAVDPFDRVLYLEPGARNVTSTAMAYASTALFAAQRFLATLWAMSKPYVRVGGRCCASVAVRLRARLRIARRS